MKKSFKSILPKQLKGHTSLAALENSIEENEHKLRQLKSERKDIKKTLKADEKALKKQVKALLKTTKFNKKTKALKAEKPDSKIAPKNGVAVKTGKAAAVPTLTKKAAEPRKTARIK